MGCPQYTMKKITPEQKKKIFTLLIFLSLLVFVALIGYFILVRFAGLEISCGKPYYKGSGWFESYLDPNYEKCVRNYAIAHNDVSICALQSNASCFYKIAKKTGNRNLCDNVKSRWSQPKCKKAVALAFADASICDKSDRSVCIANVALVKKNITDCKLLPEISSYFWCISQIAIQTKNPSLCNKIDKNRLVESFNIDICINAVSHAWNYPNPLTVEYNGELDSEF
jgi:hypothetical protein